MNLMSFATFMLAAGINLQAAYGAETKQHVRKLQSDETGEQVEKELEEELEEVAQNWWGSWGEKSVCPLQGANFGIKSAERICLILPNGMSQPGTPSGVTNGIFCAPAEQYTLSIVDVSDGSQKLLRINLDLGTIMQQQQPLIAQALTGVAAPAGETAMIVGGTAPEDIDFQGFWDEKDCSFRLVSTRGGQLIGKFNFISKSFNIEFTQTGQVTSLLDTLGGEFEDATGTITLDFAFAFKGEFGQSKW